ncbi:MAG: hypothetical protein IT461_00935 [Planctomycetes bacterium]|nr:hypothetical protein [Planctomycetota bacterium]
MTSVSFPDMRATSPGGRFSAEALSPENGTIPFPDFVPEKDRHAKSFGFQGNFRYRLIDASGRVVWERWQPEREPAPTNLYVSDFGHVVAGLHGYTAAPTVFFDGQGTIVFAVHVCTDWEGIGKNPDFSRETKVGAKAVIWKDEHIPDSTAGIFWQSNSLPCFFTHSGTHYFSIRSAWTRRLVVDLDAHVLLSDSDLASNSSPLASLELAESVIAKRVIASAADCLKGTQAGKRGSKLLKKLPELEFLAASIDVAGSHRLAEMLDVLRALESVSTPLYTTGSHAFAEQRKLSSYVHTQWLRPVVQQALWRLGVTPKRTANYRFTRGSGFGSGPELPMPKSVEDLEARTEKLNSSMSATEVLVLLGSPTFVSSFSVEAEPKRYEWGEIWEYDLMREGIASTLCIHWSHAKPGDIEKIEEVKPARWQTPAGRPYLCQ